MTGARGRAVTAASRGRRAGPAAMQGGRAAAEAYQAVRVWGISRPSRRLKRRLTTQAGEFSPEGEIHGRVFKRL